jgi:hypothetical protein
VRSWDGVGGSLWQNPAALPLFFMPATWRPTADPRQAVAATLDNRDFAAAAVAEMPEPAAEGAAPTRHQRGAARIRRAAANGFEVETTSPTGGLAVSSIAFTRGWRLAIDGLPASPLRVNAAFIGFLVPAGSHHAALEYRPAGWTWGLRLCGLTLIALLALGALPASRRRLGAKAARSEAQSP